MGFLDPIALSFSALLGALVLLYLLERWRRRIVVPSLLLWDMVPEDRLRARRFRPDLLFLLQLLLLSALIVGLARPYLRNSAAGPPPARRILVLDTSASMQAREGHSTRFEQARDEALRVLGDLRSEDEVMVLGTGKPPTVLAAFTRDHATVAQALRTVQPADTGGDLTLALGVAENARQRGDLPASVDVFTDIPRAQLPASERSRVRVFQFGESDDNLGIEALQIYQGRFQDYRRARAYVLVQNFSHRRDGHGFLTVSVGDRVIDRTGFTIPARQTKGFLFHNFPAPGRVRAQLEVSDALAADNVAYGWIRPIAPVRLLLVSRASPLVDDIQDLAAAAPGLQARVIAPADYDSADAAQADITIFNEFVPAAPAPVNAMYIYPPADNTLFPVAADAENVEVLDWAEHHPALRGVQPVAALPLQRARIIAPPPWSETLLWSRAGEREFPLAIAGELDGHRVVCFTFDIQGEHLLGSDNLNLFLLFMNALGWLAPDPTDVRVAVTGEVVPVSATAHDAVRVHDPRGATLTLPAGATTVQPQFAGAYDIAADGTRTTLLANFFDPIESDIGRGTREPPIAPPNSVSGAVPVEVRAEFRWWLYMLAAALLASEWMLARRGGS